MEPKLDRRASLSTLVRRHIPPAPAKPQDWDTRMLEHQRSRVHKVTGTQTEIHSGMGLYNKETAVATEVSPLWCEL